MQAPFDHVLPMFVVTREEVMKMFEEKLISIDETAALVEKEIESAQFEAHKNSMAKAIKFLADVKEKTIFLRDHLVPSAESWSVSAAQALEIRTALSPVRVDPAAIKFGVDKEKMISTELYNAHGRSPRW